MEDSQSPLNPERKLLGSAESQDMSDLQNLALRWFMETQAPLILENGVLPPWFHGFITRKETEQLLRDKAFGSFLIRFSDRATGYILSYRGSDRCRHFVINQLPNRRYLVSGDIQSHSTLAELVYHYQHVQLEPFGETLAMACPRVEESELYDAISLGLHKPSPSATVSLPVIPNKASSPGTSPKPQDSFLHAKKSAERQGTVSKEEDVKDPTRVPPLPERSASLLDKSPGDPNEIIYADMRKIKQMKGCLGTEASGGLKPVPSQEAPQRLLDSSQNQPGSGSGSPSAWGTLLLPSSEVPGSSSLPWSQGSQSSSSVSTTDTYEVIGSNILDDKTRPKQKEESPYQKIQVCWGTQTQSPLKKGSESTDYSNEKISENLWLPELDPGNTYEQIPIARKKDPGRAQKPEKLRNLFFADKKPRACGGPSHHS